MIWVGLGYGRLPVTRLASNDLVDLSASVTDVISFVLSLAYESAHNLPSRTLDSDLKSGRTTR
jgi:hypothetical protein